MNRMMADSQEGNSGGVVSALKERVERLKKLILSNEHVKRLLKWSNTGWRWRLQKVAPAFLTMFTILQIIFAWASLLKSSVTLSKEMPDGQCVPFFYAVKDFLDVYSNASALYSYKPGLPPLVNLCTNEKKSVVVGKFGAAVLPQMPSKDGCTWQNTSCTSVDARNAERPVASCYKLEREVLPLPNGFMYVSVATYPGEGCKVILYVDQFLPLCQRDYVYRLEGEVNLVATKVLAAGLGIPTAMMIFHFWIYYRTLKKKKSGQEMDEFDKDMYSFAWNGPTGSFAKMWVVEGAKNPCPFPHDKTPPLRVQYFILLQCQIVLEAVLIPVVAVSGCPLSYYPQTVVLIVIKIGQFVMTVKEFFFPEEPDAVTPISTNAGQILSNVKEAVTPIATKAGQILSDVKAFFRTKFKNLFGPRVIHPMPVENDPVTDANYRSEPAVATASKQLSK